MRCKLAIFLPILLPVLAGTAVAQTPPPAPPPPATTGVVDLGLRFTDVSGDAARYQRFRDLGNGGFIDGLSVERRGPNWNLQIGGNQVGRRDQRYWAQYRHSGRLKVTFLFDQVPLLMSDDTRTLYTVESPGVLRIADAVQADVQASASRLAGAVAGLGTFRMESRRKLTRLDVVYRPTRELDLKFSLLNTVREGTMPWGATFGFSNAAEVAAPIDTRTTDVLAGVEWVTANRTFRVTYDGSWFDNHVPALVWDNPWRAVDSATLGSSQGRMALWPDSTLHSITAAGSIRMRARTHLNGGVTIGRGRQNDALLPLTINAQLPQTPLSRPTTEAEVRNLAVNLGLTSRPNSKLWLSARLRYYDSDNRMPAFTDPSYVRLDQLVTTTFTAIATRPLSFTRANIDLDASYTLRPFTALRVGYSRDASDRENRIFERTTEDVVRASLDTTVFGWLTLRGIGERAARTGSGLRPELLARKQPATRHFDIANRDRDRVTALVQAAPWKVIGFSVSASKGVETYNNAEFGAAGFGLRDADTRMMTASVDLLPAEKVAVGIWYAYETYSAFQRSRQATAALFTDARRDWMVNSDERVHTWSVSLDLTNLRDKMDVQVGYDSSRSSATYLYGVVPGSTLAAPMPLPVVRNIVETARAEFSWALSSRVSLGLLYRFDRYRVDDFAMGPATMTRLDMPGSLFLGYLYRPYRANSAWLRLSYRWQ